MLTMVFVEGIYAPMFTCDVCGKPIKNGDHGMVKFDESNTQLFFCHKRDIVKGCDRRSDDAKYPLWHELSTFLIWLEQNTPFDRKTARFRADCLASIGM
jgi:hypothetical protein